MSATQELVRADGKQGEAHADRSLAGYLVKGVKEVIEEFPQVGEILDQYGVGCVRCAEGSCTLADVVKIHALAPAQEAQMMAEVESAINLERVEAQPPFAPLRRPAPPRAIKYSPPVRKLVGEHEWIKRLLAVIPTLIEDMSRTGKIDAELMQGALGFIRGYADRFHHIKEEDILFDYTDKEAEIIRVMYEDHERGRSYVRAASQAVEEGDVATLCRNLSSYRDLLTEHISKEDEVLYPYIDRGLSTHQVGEVSRRFEQAERKAGQGVRERYESFILELEKQASEREVNP